MCCTATTEEHNSCSLNIFGAIKEETMLKIQKHSQGQTRHTTNLTEVCFNCVTGRRYNCTTGDSEHVCSVWLQQFHILVDSDMGSKSFCPRSVRNADDLLLTAPIASAETSFVIVCCLSGLSSSFSFFSPSVSYSLSRFFRFFIPIQLPLSTANF